MFTRRSILKTLLALPFAPLEKWFPATERDPLGGLPIPLEVISEVPFDGNGMAWERWMPAPTILPDGRTSFRHEIRGYGTFDMPKRIGDIELPRLGEGWIRSKLNITVLQYSTDAKKRHYVEVSAVESLISA